MRTSTVVLCLAVSWTVTGLVAFAAPEAQDKPLSVASYPSIQQAIDENPGKMLFVPAGDHSISAPIRINKNRSGLYGPGRIIQSNSQRPIIHVEHASEVQLRDLTLTRSQAHMDVETEAMLAIDCTNL